MPEISIAETYFIIIMMALILAVCAVATYVFFRQYKIEMKMREAEKQRKLALKAQSEKAEAE